MARSLLVVLLAIASVFAKGERRYTVKRDLRYGPGKSARFDAYRPARGRPPSGGWPALVFIHGGGWTEGDKEQGRDLAVELCSQGYAVLAIDYRLAKEARWPAPLEDCQRAIRYFRANARTLGIDPERIGTIGISAGGHLAAMTALRDDLLGGRVKVAVDMDGAMDLTLPPRECFANYDAIVTAVLGHGPPFAAAELRDLSPIAFVRSDVSLLLIHGEHDENVYVKNADVMAKALEAKGADVEYLRLEDALGHCHGNCWKAAVARERLHAFLARRLGRRWL